MQQALHIAKLVEIAVRHHRYSPNCLERSVTLWALLGKQGILAEICFGARRDAGRLAAHAWVEYNGAVLNDAEDVSSQYSVLGDIEGLLVERVF